MAHRTRHAQHRGNQSLGEERGTGGKGEAVRGHCKITFLGLLMRELQWITAWPSLIRQEASKPSPHPFHVVFTLSLVVPSFLFSCRSLSPCLKAASPSVYCHLNFDSHLSSPFQAIRLLLFIALPYFFVLFTCLITVWEVDNCNCRSACNPIKITKVTVSGPLQGSSLIASKSRKDWINLPGPSRVTSYLLFLAHAQESNREKCTLFSSKLPGCGSAFTSQNRWSKYSRQVSSQSCLRVAWK